MFNGLIFIYKLLRNYPALLIRNVLLFIFVGFFGAFSLLSVSPIIDFIMHPNLQGISPLTEKIIKALQFFNLPVTLSFCLGMFLVLIVLSSIVQIIALQSILKTKYAVLRDIIKGSFEDFFNARWHFFSSSKQGTLLNSYIRELPIVGDSFSSIAQLFSSLIQTIAYLIVPLYISWKVTFISFSCTMFFAIPFILLGKRGYQLGVLNTSTANQISTGIHENLSLTKILLGFGNQEKNINKLTQAFDAHTVVTIKSQVLNVAIPLLYRPCAVVVVIVSFFCARFLNVPISELTVLLLALFQAANSLAKLVAQKVSLENVLPSYEQIEGLRHRARELKQISGDKVFAGFKKTLSVNNLSFAYPDNDMVLKNVTVTIPKNNMIAFVGKSGMGKSTLIDLIMGFHHPNKGVVTFDDISLQEYDITSYRRRIGYVPQDSALFNMSIRDNLLWANEDASYEDIQKACQLANAREFIEQFPDKYDTIVGDRGIRLSGGQVQRVALARALIRQPELLILDEATSALDTQSERLIQQAVENIANKTTIIVVAHRLSTIKCADCIYVLDKGQIIESGNYKDLVSKNGYFSSMAQLQELEILT